MSTAVGDLSNTNGSINSLTATSSNSNLVTASADPTAGTGSHTIVVNSLATTSSYYTDPVASSSTAIGTGSFQITVGGNPAATVTVDSTNNTLSGLAAAINGQNLGVTASVVTDASGARLAIVSGTTGLAGNITVANNTNEPELQFRRHRRKRLSNRGWRANQLDEQYDIERDSGRDAEFSGCGAGNRP